MPTKKRTTLASAQVIDLVPQEDLLETKTGMALIDADPRVMARRLRLFSWKRRCLFFTNIATDSYRVAIFCCEHVDEAEQERYLAWFMTKCSERIGQTLDYLEIDEPDC